MKVLAIASASAALTPDLIQKHLPSEVPATLKLYLDGKISRLTVPGQGREDMGLPMGPIVALIAPAAPTAGD